MMLIIIILFTVRHNELNGTEGTLESPAYPAKFHSHDMYSWRITVHKDYVVLLTIKHIVDTDMPYIKVSSELYDFFWGGGSI